MPCRKHGRRHRLARTKVEQSPNDQSDHHARARTLSEFSTTFVGEPDAAPRSQESCSPYQELLQRCSCCAHRLRLPRYWNGRWIRPTGASLTEILVSGEMVDGTLKVVDLFSVIRSFSHHSSIDNISSDTFLLYILFFPVIWTTAFTAITNHNRTQLFCDRYFCIEYNSDPQFCRHPNIRYLKVLFENHNFFFLVPHGTNMAIYDSNTVILIHITLCPIKYYNIIPIRKRTTDLINLNDK